MTDDKFGNHHVSDQVICADKIAGCYVLDPGRAGSRGDGTEPGLLYVEKRSDGRWYDAERNCRIEAMEIVPLDVVTRKYTIIEDEYYREFVPDPGECERVGMPVRRRRARPSLYVVEIAGRSIVIGGESGLSGYLEHGVERAPDGEFVRALGGGLEGLENASNPGHPIWRGEPSSLHFRDATDAEIDLWQRGLRQAQERTKREVDIAGWLVFLVPVRELSR